MNGGLHIITLGVDEPQLQRQRMQIETAKEDAFTAITHSSVIGFGATEAMQKFYELANDKTKPDIVLKLDGDMTFYCSDSLKKIYRMYRDFEGHRLTLKVFDHVCMEYIYGAHIFDRKALESNIEVTAYKRDDFITAISGVEHSQNLRLIEHCTQPRSDQLFNYGVNRGLKLRVKKQNFLPSFFRLIFLSVKYSSRRIAVNGFLYGYFEAESHSIQKNYCVNYSRIKSLLLISRLLLENLIFVPYAVFYTIREFLGKSILRNYV